MLTENRVPFQGHGRRFGQIHRHWSHVELIFSQTVFVTKKKMKAILAFSGESKLATPPCGGSLPVVARSLLCPMRRGWLSPPQGPQTSARHIKELAWHSRCLSLRLHGVLRLRRTDGVDRRVPVWNESAFVLNFGSRLHFPRLILFCCLLKKKKLNNYSSYRLNRRAKLFLCEKKKICICEEQRYICVFVQRQDGGWIPGSCWLKHCSIFITEWGASHCFSTAVSNARPSAI